MGNDENHGMSAGLSRVTISAPQRRLDVALPEHVPLAELLPDVLRHAGEGLADDGEKHGGWLLRRGDGVALAAAQGLFPQGVRDGEVLHLVPAREQWPELEYDDVVEAIAEGARRGTVWSPAATRASTLTAGGVLLSLGLIAVLTAGPGWGGAAFFGLGVALLLTVAAITAARAYGDTQVGVVLGGCALPYAFAGGAVLVAPAEGDRVGVLAMLPWIGGPELLAGTVVLLVVAVLGGAGVGAFPRMFVAAATVGLLGALTSVTALVTTAAGAAAALLSLLICGIGVLPLLAIRLGKLPAPPVTVDAAAERPDRERVFDAVHRTEEMLAGLLIGHALLSAGAFVVLAASGGISERILMGLGVAALLLRSRLFVTLRQRLPLILAGLAGLAALGVDLLLGADDAMLLGVGLGGLLLAMATVAAGATWSRRAPSPYLGRAADVTDVLVVVAVIPVACAVLGLYGLAASVG
jgi:type VII secretion integral membrane protein EccD